jgi:undecaprenyl-diphosphatase
MSEILEVVRHDDDGTQAPEATDGVTVVPEPDERSTESRRDRRRSKLHRRHHHRPDEAVYVHAPQSLARLIVYAVAFALVGVAGRVFDRSFDGFTADLLDLGHGMGDAVGAVVQALVITGAVVVVAAAVVVAQQRGGARFAKLTGAAAALTAVVAVELTHVATDRSWMSSVDARTTVFAATALTAIEVVRDQLGVGVSRLARWVVVLLAIVSAGWTAVPLAFELLAIVGGLVIGAAVALVGGTPSLAPTSGDVAVALDESGVPLDVVVPHDVDARGSVPWLARSATGRLLFVKTHTPEQRSAELLFRGWRLVRLRRSGDGVPDSTLRRSVEHEAFVAGRANTVGVRAPRLVAIGRLGGRSMFAAYEAIAGRTFADLGDDVTDAQLRSAWSMTRALHRVGIAHRDLRAANLLVDDAGEVWIVDFGVAELAATPRQLRTDVVELLASTASIVGIDRAVAAATEMLGVDDIEAALPLLQPAALSAATRKATGKEALDDLRRAAIEATGAPEPEEPRLERVRLKTVLMIAALGIALWILLPQVLSHGELWGQVLQADRPWVVAGLLASALTYLAATVSLLGAVPDRVHLGRLFTAQVANSFTNRITPASLGSMALNTRLLAREGSGTATAATSVGLSATAGVVVHVVIVVFALAWAGSAGLGDVALPDARTIVVTLVVIALVVAVGMAITPLRQFLRRKLAPPLRESWTAVVEIARRPHKVLMLFGGSVLVTVLNLTVLVLSLRAFGMTPPIAAVAVVYLAGSAIGGAMPTPGGLGATEAALVAGLTAIQVLEAPALGAVLLFRILTFWLPILPGWVAFVTLQRRGWI